jgi:anthranilate synthase component II
MFVLIDNYDSFTYNLYHFLGELGAEVVVHRNDAVSVDAVLDQNPEGIVISPGPCDPDSAGISLDMVHACAKREIPLLGVCLGHEAIGQAMGGKVVRAPEPMHGKLSAIKHDGSGVFADLESPFRSTRYHSLVIERDSMPDCLEISAETDDGVIMGLAHRSLPIHGVQFHPESIASENGHKLLKNFLSLSSRKRN